ncbi:DUF3298 and DUF4163 domain-containing protein [Neobacillus sp. PS3-34]|uniref:DUF3298 and DUF4163 domain-containing protein n=1 Tax=Neobacillus sp. PS3-34 TaxID=3070678 RepID=UPI0027E21580|nr:DUF3298 and DUF4163 domain-containing protein [Neobacillus sp. PS3-34]WML46795.1 DUF3298 and DUF4163 domain-containing protein [Neobacillus sp. PS3-34]
MTVLKQTNLYMMNGVTKTFVKKLSPGEVYRIYNFLPGKLGLGAGYFIDRDSRIKYQTPSKEKLQALGVTVLKIKYQGVLDYPQVTNLLSKAAQDKINVTLKKHINDSYTALLRLEAQEKEDRQKYLDEHGYPVPKDEDYMYSYEYDVTYQVKYNENNQLSLLVYDYIYTGGAHGMEIVTSYNFNVLTGQQLKLGDIAQSTTGFNKIKKYAIADLMNRAKRGEGIFTGDLNKMEINNNRPFYFTSNGIAIIFQEYEVAPYAAGMPEVKIPYKVFK